MGMLEGSLLNPVVAVTLGGQLTTTGDMVHALV